MQWVGGLVLVLFFVILYSKDHIVFCKDSSRQKDVRRALAFLKELDNKFGFWTSDQCYHNYLFLSAENYFHKKYTSDAYEKMTEAKEAFESDGSLVNLYSVALFRQHIMSHLEQYQSVSLQGYLIDNGNHYLLSPYPLISANAPEIPFDKWFFQANALGSIKSTDAVIGIPLYPGYGNESFRQQLMQIYESADPAVKPEKMRFRITAAIAKDTVTEDTFGSYRTEDILVLSDCNVEMI